MKPSRYVGTEFNSVHKDPSETDLRVALVFPDLYDLGLGNLGLQILYATLNELPWCWAERAYAPAPDMEAALRERGLPIFTWESKTPLAGVDLIGFSLQSELTYTSVLSILNLAGIPLHASERTDEHPIIIAGGPGALNPEPMAPFIDAFVLGDGEDAVIEIAQALRTKPAARLEALTPIPGVYVPKLHKGRMIARRLVEDLGDAAFPTRLVVPFTQLVHDRAGIEVMRGCSHGCRFCLAGTVNRPVRERSPGVIAALMDQTLEYSGYEEVSLVSLSTCDHSGIRDILRQAAARAHSAGVAVSLPSLRLDTFSVELADAISGVRRSSLTFAPEAATPRLRAVINKTIEDDTLLDVAEEVFKRGWRHVKLYFMIGLPSEEDEDVAAIADLCLRVLDRGRQVTRNAQVVTGISTFVPKPHTPFQWAPQIGLEETRRKHSILEQAFKRKPGIKLRRHEPEASFIEGLIARSGREAARLIETAFRNGARLDSSSEYLDFEAWQKAIEETGFDALHALRERALDEPLPWDHIDALVSKDWLQAEWQRSLTRGPTPDCRQGTCSQCGLTKHAPALCADIQRKAKQTQDAILPLALHPRNEPLPIQRIRFRIGRLGEARFLSHLEMSRAWTRVLRRAHAPMAYSQGFHAHPKVTFATAPPVGEESEGDYMDVMLRKRVDPAVLLERLRATLPRDLRVYEAVEVPLKNPSLMSAVIGFDYMFHATADTGDIAKRVRGLLAAETIPVERKGRPTGRRKSKAVKHVDIRPAIQSLTVSAAEDASTVIALTTMSAGGKLAKPREIIQLLGLDPATTRVLKRATHLAK